MGMRGDQGDSMMKKLLYTIVISFTIQYMYLYAQMNRITYNDQELFLSGANVAWINFANDIGPGYTHLDGFAEMFLDIHDHGGNAMRLWLHTDGTSTPEFDGEGNVIGPGEGTINDLEAILDLAWEREVGLILCLWSFDMLHQDKDAAVITRNTALLTDTTKINGYIQNALIPMVDSLKEHPAIISWEIFNEPEGMSDQFGWGNTYHVPMSDIQRFINLSAAAIHRTDSTALVSNGSWSFNAQTDIFADTTTTKNYYTDTRLIAAGGDSAGILDFYMVHYYDWAGTTLSPFHHAVSHWELDKPLVIGEFHAKDDLFGVPSEYLFNTLYDSGYAGALGWAYGDQEQLPSILSNIQYMWDNYNDDVDLDGIGGDWPLLTITAPADNSTFPDSSDISIEVTAWDPDGSVIRVEFFEDTTKLGEDTDKPYSYLWEDVPAGRYKLKARVTDNQNHLRTSDPVNIIVGELETTILEAEVAEISGDISIENDSEASNGKYAYMKDTGSITWYLTDVPADSEYNIKIGYQSPMGTKTQYLYVNGTLLREVVFDSTFVWQNKTVLVPLNAGSDTIRIEPYWGWMYFDYIEVPYIMEIPSVIADHHSEELPIEFSLSQNYPNPFNSTTKLNYQLAKNSKVKLVVYDIQGRIVKNLINRYQTAGNYTLLWNGLDNSGKQVSSGIYFIQFKTDHYQKVIKTHCIK
jgi:hypothetical protein